jgi:hypothetical protein
MELEAKHKLKKLFPDYKIESVYITWNINIKNKRNY